LDETQMHQTSSLKKKKMIENGKNLSKNSMHFLVISLGEM
jgi:hypothetical protein